MGFDQFFSIENWGEEMDRLRNYCSDQSLYNLSLIHILLRNYEGNKASVKRNGIVIYWEQKLPMLLETLHTSPW